MNCSNCGFENQEGSVFCSKCGEKLFDHQTNAKIEKEQRSFYKSKRFIVSILIAVVVISGLSLLFLDNAVADYKHEINNNNVAAANDLYNEKIKDNREEVEEVKEFLQEESKKMKESFINHKMNYEEVKERMDIIQGTDLLTEKAKENIRFIEQLNDSRNSFQTAQKYQEENKYIEAIREYDKVIEEDENFESAQQEIKAIQVNYKQDVLNKAQQLVDQQEYEKALSLLKEANSILSEEQDIKDKMALVEEKQIEKLQAEQIVVVENAKITVQTTDSVYKFIYPDMIQVTVKNLSDKTIKKMEVACLGFDQNGYPVKILPNMSFSDGVYEFIGHAQDVNIVPGARFGEGVGWELDESHGISTVISSVKNVTFYDGSVWSNPYYSYWAEKYKEKPLS